MVNSSWNAYAYTAHIIIVDKKVGFRRRPTINPHKTCLIAYSASTTVVCSPCTEHQNKTLKTKEEEPPTLKESTGTYEAYVYSFSLAPSSSFRFPREEVSADHGTKIAMDILSSFKRMRCGTLLIPRLQSSWLSFGSMRTSAVPMCFLANWTTDWKRVSIDVVTSSN
jgi:hypothetical protein